jgi:signal peptidase II
VRRFAALLAIAGGVLALDQWTKHLATVFLAGRPSVRLLDDIVQLTYALNSGVAFSLGAGTRFPFYLFSMAAAAAIVWLFARDKVRRPVQRVALALVLGGALGNLVDRISTGLVVDFIELGFGRFRWPVFNVADSAVSIGVVLFILTGSSLGEPAPADGIPPAGGPGADSPAGPEGPAEIPHDEANARAIGDPGAGGATAGSLPRDDSGRPLA